MPLQSHPTPVSAKKVTPRFFGRTRPAPATSNCAASQKATPAGRPAAPTKVHGLPSRWRAISGFSNLSQRLPPDCNTRLDSRDSPRNAINSTAPCFLYPHQENNQRRTRDSYHGNSSRPQPPSTVTNKPRQQLQQQGIEEHHNSSGKSWDTQRRQQHLADPGNTRTAAAASEPPSNRHQYLRGAVGPAQMSCELDARCVTPRPNGSCSH
jgi:hypothetical protein